MVEELSAQDIYELGQELDPFVIASGTRMGHVHLSVKNSREGPPFTTFSVGLKDKFTLHTPVGLHRGITITGPVCHEWEVKLSPREQGMAGPAYYVVEGEQRVNY